MGTYRKKPIEIEAFEFLVDNIPDWFMDKVSSNDITLLGKGFRETYGCEIKTLEGRMLAEKGDFIIKGIKGEIYPCKADIFNQSYDKVDH